MSKIYRFDGWQLDAGRRSLRRPDGTEVRVTSGEYDLMAVFCQRPQQPIARWEFCLSNAGCDRTMDVKMTRLRRKIEKDPNCPVIIRTIRNGGYYFTPEVVSHADAD